MMMLMPGQHLQWVVILNMCRRNYISHPPSSWQFYIHWRWVEAAMKRFKRHQNGIFSPRMAVPVPKSPPKTIIAKYPHIFSGSYDCGDIVGRWWGLQVGYCAAVDNFGAMAPEIRLLPARSDIHPPLLRQKICHRKYRLENTSVKSYYIKSVTQPYLERRALCIKLIGVLLSSMQAELQFHFRRENNSQSKAKPFHTLSNTTVFEPEVNKYVKQRILVWNK